MQLAHTALQQPSSGYAFCVYIERIYNRVPFANLLTCFSYLQKRDDLAISFLVDSPHIHKAVVLSPPQRTALRCKEYCGLDFFSAPHYNNTNRAEVKGGKYKRAIYFPPRLSLLVL